MISVSIIIPVYNTAPYLRQCLDSVLSQTLPDSEILCVDDGSTDGSAEILKEYAETHPGLAVFSQKNSGAGAARNLGLRHAKGRYVSFLDADDFFEPDMLAEAVKAIEEKRADICVFRSDRYHQASGEFEMIPWTIKTKYLPGKEPFSMAELPDYAFQVFNGWAWDKLYRKESIDKAGLEFQSLRTTNDAFFVFMMNLQAGAICTLDKILAHHRVDTGHSLSVTREKSWDCCGQAIEAIRKELLARGQYGTYERSFINWGLHFLLWNIRTLQGESRQKLIGNAEGTYFPLLGIEKHPPDYFYFKNEYRQYLELKGKRPSSPHRNLLWSAVYYCKENGVRATIKRIRSYLRYKR